MAGRDDGSEAEQRPIVSSPLIETPGGFDYTGGDCQR
jgi:hypothetical protein